MKILKRVFGLLIYFCCWLLTDSVARAKINIAGLSWQGFSMGERRKRKSFWDMEEETKHLSGMSEPNSWTGKERHSNYDGGHYHGFSASGSTSVPKSIDDSGWASWETTEENPTALMGDSFVKGRQDAPEVKEIGGINRYHKNTSPGFDGMERRNYNNTFEEDRSHSRRYPERGRSMSRSWSRSRSRSRSRGRTSGRSRSRSLSRGRGRERERRRGWSRSRSRSNGSVRGQTRSRSPIGDYRRQSYGWSDRTRGPDKSSQSCRDFVAGSCRRGSQCRFLHPNNISHRDGDHMEDEPAESWRNRADRSRISKHAYSRGSGFEMQDDVSDPYHGKDEFPTKGRNPFPCKDFMRGNCRWADTCKFSHHVASGDSFGKGIRIGSFDKDIVRQSNQYGKPICKFFAAGKCDRDNCRFSHEDPKLNNQEGRRTEVIDHRGLHDKSNWSDDAPRVSDTVNPLRWSETLVTNTNSTGGTTSGKSDDRWGHSMENESKTWGIPEWKENSLNREKQRSPPEESGSQDRDMGTAEAIGKDNMANKQEQLVLRGSQLQNQDGVLNVQQQNTMQEDHSFSIKALQQNISSASHILQQRHGVVENNLLNQFGPVVLDGVKDSRNTTRPIFFSGQNLNQNGESAFLGRSSISNKTDRGENMLYPTPSNEFITDSNGPETNIAAPLNLQAQMQNHQKAVKSPEMLESKVLQFFPNLLTNEHSAQVTNSPVAITGRQVAPVTENPAAFLSQRFVNEQSQIYPGVELSNYRGMMPSFSDTSVHVPPVNTANAQLNSVTVSLDLFNPLENGRDTREHGNHYLAPGTEQNSHMHVKQSSPLSVGINPDNSKVKHPESPQLKQEEEAPATSEEEALGEESKDVKLSETLDGHGKVEEGSGNKDEKGMRAFKNALIEFVKEILKPTWKEGRMSREVHKTVVKKVVDKVTSTIQVDHIPRTPDKVEHYLSYSKPKITKLVQAYVERCLKTDS